MSMASTPTPRPSSTPTASPKPRPSLKPSSEPKAKAKARAATEPKAKAKSRAGQQPKAGPKAGPKTGPKAAPKPRGRPKADPNAEPNAEPKRKAVRRPPVVGDGILVASGPPIQGTVSAWYDSDGLFGQDYGFIERLIPAGSVPGQKFSFIEHHYFEKADVECPVRMKPGMVVEFRSAGRDRLGRWRALHIKIPTGDSGPCMMAPLGLVSPRKRCSEVTPSKPTAMDVTRELVLKAWKKLGGEATWHEIVNKIKTDKKLSERVLLEFGSERQDSADEVWEELVPKILKAEGEWTQEKRAFEGSKTAAKVFKMLDE